MPSTMRLLLIVTLATPGGLLDGDGPTSVIEEKDRWQRKGDQM